MRKILLFVQLLLPLILATPRLRQLFQMCRHGARAPGRIQHPDLWTYEQDELTSQGARQHYLIGNELRKELIVEDVFLDRQYNPHQIYVKSTPYSRTSQSARSQLLGLYPQGSGPTLSWQQMNWALPPFAKAQAQEIAKELGSDALQERADVIPVHQTKGVPDYILGDFHCKKQQTLLLLTMSTPKYKNGLKPFQVSGLGQVVDRLYDPDYDMFDYSSLEFTDDMISTDFQYPGDDIYNLTWSNIESAKSYQNYVFYKGYNGNYESVQLIQTSFFQDLLTRFKECIANDKIIGKLEEDCKTAGMSSSECAKAKTSEQNRLKFTFYSGHDMSIAAMAAFMELTQFGDSPPFASTFFFKLKATNETLTGNEADYFVEVLLNGATVITFQDFPTFEKFINDRTIKGDINEACNESLLGGSKKAPTTYSSTQNNMKKYLIYGIPIAVGILVIGIIACVLLRRRKQKHMVELNEEVEEKNEGKKNEI